MKRTPFKLLSMILALALVISIAPSIVLVGKAAAVDATSFIQVDANGIITRFEYEAGISPEEIIIPVTWNEITIKGIADSVFGGCGLYTIEFAAGSQIESIGANAFQNNYITEIDLPDTVTSIGSNAFYNCTRLESIDLSALQIVEVPTNCFSGCSALNTVLLPTWSGFTTIGNTAFNAGSYSGVVIPASVTSIGVNAFSGMMANETLDLSAHAPDSINGAPWGYYYGYLKWADSGNENTSDFIFNKTTGMICGLKLDYSGDGNITIPTHIDGIEVKGLMTGAFSTLPSRTAIYSAVIDPTVSFTEIPERTFFSVSRMTSINIPEGITTLGEYVFSGCSYITSIVFPSTLLTIGNSAFGSTGLTSVTIPASVTSIGANAFASAAGLTTFTVEGDAGLTMAATTFSSMNNTNLTSIYVLGYEKDTIANAPWNAKNATVYWKDATVAPDAAVTDASGLWSFWPSTGLIEAYLGTNDATTDLVVPSTLYYQGTAYQITGFTSLNVVKNGSSLKSLTFEEGITSINSQNFYRVKIGTLNLPNTLSTISSSSFYDCGLTSLTLPESLTSINSLAFGSNNLTGEIIIPGLVTLVTTTTFSGNDGITQFTIKRYRTQDSDGVYNDAEGKYLKAGTGLINNAPFGVEAASNYIYFMDDPRPIYEYVVTPDPHTNTATVTVSVKVSDNSIISEIVSEDGETLYNMSLASDGSQLSTFELQDVDANGEYTFKTTFRYGAKTHYYTLEVSIFHGVTYEGNYHTGGTAPTDSATYMEGASFNLAAKGSLVKENATFIGWSETQNDVITTQEEENASGVISTAAHTMGDGDMTLYAVWARDINGNGTPDYKETTYSLIYDKSSNDVTGSPPATVTGNVSGDTVVLDTTGGTMVRDGYCFYCWAKDGEISEIGSTSEAAVIDGSKKVTSVTFASNNITVYAVWAVDTNGDNIPDFNQSLYTVTYLPNAATAGAVPVDSNTYAPAAQATILGNTGGLEKTGHTFAGWNTAADGAGTDYAAGSKITLNGSAVLYAKWTANQYSVTFNNDSSKGTMGTPTTPSVTFGTAIGSGNVPSITAKTGYTFTGWLCSADGGIYSSTAVANYYLMTTQAVSFTAQYDAVANATAVFNFNGGTDGLNTSYTTSGTPGGTYTIPTPTRDGYTFLSWSPTTSLGVYGASGTTTTYTAQWTADDVTVQFVNDTAKGALTGNNTVVMKYDSAIGSAAPSIVAKTGYVFVGWTCSVDGLVYNTDAIGTYVVKSAAGVTFTAKYENSADATVVFNYNGGVDIQGESGVTMSGQPGTSYDIPTASRTGYEFASWSPTLTGTTGQYGDASSTTVYTAQWTAKSYTIQFVTDTNKGTLSGNSTITVDYGSAIGSAAPSILEKTGYVFSGWLCSADGIIYNASALATYVMNETSTVTFTAQFENAGNATVILNYNGGKVGADTFAFYTGQPGTAYSFTVPTRDGYDFAGWSPTLTGTSGVFGVSGTVTSYTAQWTAKSFSVQFRTDLSKGTMSLSGTPTPLSYLNVTVDYDSAIGSLNIPDVTVNAGYVFTGWLCSVDGGVYDATAVASYILKTADDTVRFTAQFELGSDAVAIFDFGGGTNGISGYVTLKGSPGGTYLVPTPHRSGYEFVSWSADGTATAGTYGSAGSVTTYTAQWTAGSYAVLFENDDAKGAMVGTPSFPVEYNTAIGAVPVITEGAGYVFTGWLCSADDMVYSPAQVSTYIMNSVTLLKFTAQYSDSDTATVVFNFGGGADDDSNPGVSYSGKPGTVYTIPAPQRTGYDFIAWSPALTGATGTYGSAGSVTTYLAMWDAKMYTVNFVSDAEKGTMTGSGTASVAYGSPIGISNVPELKAGAAYTFLGWQCSLDGGIYSDTAVGSYVLSSTSGVTFTAIYESSVEATVIFDYNGGTIGTATFKNIYGAPGESFDVPKPVRAGYTLASWQGSDNSTLTGETGTYGAAGSTLTYTAQWNANTYTASLEANGGTAASPDLQVTFDQPYGAIPVPTREGHTFDGWYTPEGEKVTEETVVSIPDDHDLTARWTANGYDVTLHPDGGTVSPEKITVTYNTPYGTLPQPVRDGYIFDGWYDGDGNLVTGETTMLKAEDHGLTAHWTAISGVLDVRGGAAVTLLGQWKNEDTAKLTFYVRMDGAPLTAGDLDKLTFKLETKFGFADLTAANGTLFGVDRFANFVSSDGVIAYQLEGTQEIESLEYAKVTVTVKTIKSSIVRVLCGYDGSYTATGYYDIITPCDVDANGRINASDYTALLRIVNEKTPAPGTGEANSYAFELYDADGDGRISASDYGVILRMINERILSN